MLFPKLGPPYPQDAYDAMLDKQGQPREPDVRPHAEQPDEALDQGSGQPGEVLGAQGDQVLFDARAPAVNCHVATP